MKDQRLVLAAEVQIYTEVFTEKSQNILCQFCALCVSVANSFSKKNSFVSLRLCVTTFFLFSFFFFSAFSQTETIQLNDSTQLEMVFVEGGTFTMGSDEGKKDARPAHEVNLNDFYIGKFEFTQEQWIAILGTNPSEIPCMKCPVNDFSWEQLMDFIAKLNELTGKSFRLPTEAEWEYAAQGGKQTKGYLYSGSNTISEVAWLKDNGSNQQHEVGLLKPNELGLYDMNGNAWELCQDWYDKNFYHHGPKENPINTKEAKYRVSRGASWMSGTDYCLRWYRNIDHWHHKRGNGGFRLVMVS